MSKSNPAKLELAISTGRNFRSSRTLFGAIKGQASAQRHQNNRFLPANLFPKMDIFRNIKD